MDFYCVNIHDIFWWRNFMQSNNICNIFTGHHFDHILTIQVFPLKHLALDCVLLPQKATKQLCLTVSTDEPLEFLFRADLFTFDVILGHCEKVLLLGDVLHSLLQLRLCWIDPKCCRQAADRIRFHRYVQPIGNCSWWLAEMEYLND